MKRPQRGLLLAGGLPSGSGGSETSLWSSKHRAVPPLPRSRTAPGLQLWKGGGGRAKKKDPFGSRKPPEKKESLSGAQSHQGKAGTVGKERAQERERYQV